MDRKAAAKIRYVNTMAKKRTRKPPRRIQKPKLDPFVVIVDTNMLWFKDKEPPVNPEFDELWSELESMVSLELVIPEVVRGEILFQHTTSAQKAIDKAFGEIELVSKITAKKQHFRYPKDRIRKQIEKKIDEWIKGKKAAVAATPYDEIDWSDLCQRSIWRQPPFTFDPKDSKTEKGFRDALILETVVSVARAEKRKVNLSFLCGDFLLRTTSDKRLKDDERFSSYETAADFASFIKLAKDETNQKFVRAILNRARRKFYADGEPDCLWRREKLVDRIRDEFDSYFEKPELSQDSSLPLLRLIHGDLRAVGSGRWKLGKPEFISIEGERTYHWRSVLTFAQLYVSEGERGGSESFFQVHEAEKILVLPFSVFWKADIKADGRFYKIDLETIELTGNEYRNPLKEDREKFRSLWDEEVEETG